MELKPHHHHWIILSLVFCLASLALYGYFLLFSPTRLEIIYQNWDGPVYAVIAESLYQPEKIKSIPYATFKQPEDFASSFPLYPLLIRTGSFIGYFRAMILLSLVFSLATIIAFYELVRLNKFSSHPLLLSLIFIFLPPRWFISSHIGSSEPLFIFLILLSLIYFFRRSYLPSGLLLGLAQLARGQGLFFFIGFILIGFSQLLKDKRRQGIDRVKHYLFRFAPYLAAPVALAALFAYFQLTYGDFFAFFKAMSKWQQIGFFPFKVFTAFPHHHLVTTFWLQNHFWIYFIDILTIILLFKKHRHQLALLAASYSFWLLFLIHIDLSRYHLPLVPFLLIAFESIIATPTFLAACLALLPALYGLSIKFMFWNR